MLADAVMLRGDERAFRELYRRHSAALYQLALRIVGGSEVDAQDVIQETWVRATTRLGQFRWESSLRTWLSGITINLSREVLRRRARRPTMSLDDAPEPSVAPLRVGDRVDLERAIAALPPGSRMVLILHDIEGYTHEEIARRLKVTAGTSKSQLFAARRALRVMLQHRESIPNA
jgi:RNA polymerase sigma-70 factor (ECF subfamily)